MPKKIVENGDEVRDTVTGLKGIVTGTTEYLHGCRRMIVQPKVGKDGKHPDSCWVDEPQLVIVKKRAVKGTPPTTGGPKEIPRDMRTPQSI